MPWSLVVWPNNRTGRPSAASIASTTAAGAVGHCAVVHTGPRAGSFATRLSALGHCHCARLRSMGAANLPCHPRR